MIIDTHCHVGSNWYEPVETLLYHMDQHAVGKAVLIQLLGQFDNAYQQKCLHAQRGRFASVIGIDPNHADSLHDLGRLAEEGAVGVRLRPNARSAGPDPLAIWKMAEKLGLCVSCVGTSAAFGHPEFAWVIEAVPGLPIVLEHMGSTSKPDADEPERRARKTAFGLARYPNVYLKLSGLGEILPRTGALPNTGSPWGYRMPEQILAALDRFGPDRIMWGSDFPVVSSREGYGNALQWSKALFSDYPKDIVERVFGENAARVFMLGTK